MDNLRQLTCFIGLFHIVSSSHDNTLRVWNETTGQCVVGPFEGHTTWIASVTYSPDGHHIVTESEDSSIKVWKAQELVSFDRLSVKHSWIQFSDGMYGWVIHWNQNSFALPVPSLVISSANTFQVEVDSALFEESWTSCWI